jgi:hypothetical protein
MRFMTWFLGSVLLTLIGYLILNNFGSWAMAGTPTMTDLGHGARLIVKQTNGPVDVKLTLVVFDSRQCSIRILAQQKLLKAKPAAEMLGDGIAICNGGYYGLNADGFFPCGLEIADAVRTGVFESGSGSTGALVVRLSGMSLVEEGKFRDGSDITQLIECGPRLVTDRVALPRTRQEARVPRTFIATDGGNRWCIGVTSKVGLTELAALITTPGIMDECPVHQALNLDGGPSTTMAWREADGTIQAVPQKPAVRNYVQVVPIKKPR